MLDIITYEEFLTHFKKLGFSSSEAEDQHYSLNEVVKPEDVIYFYPKNYYFENKSTDEAELYLLGKEKIQIVKFLPEGRVSLECRYIKDIYSYELIHKDRGPSNLTIHFKHNKTLVLESETDSAHRKNQLKQTILEIYKFINI